MTDRSKERTLPEPLARDAAPMDVARCDALSKDVRRSLLQEWLSDEIAVARAASEGMDSGPAPRVAEIERAIDALEG